MLKIKSQVRLGFRCTAKEKPQEKSRKRRKHNQSFNNILEHHELDCIASTTPPHHLHSCDAYLNLQTNFGVGRLLWSGAEEDGKERGNVLLAISTLTT